MNETLTEVLAFANQNPSSWMATTEDGQPRVRGMLLWFADETGFYYHTAKAKRVYQQLLKDPRIEVAFIRNPQDPVNFEMLRVCGTVEMIENKELEKRLYDDRPWLWGNINRAGVETTVGIFKITKGSAYIWNMAHNVKESEIPRIEF